MVVCCGKRTSARGLPFLAPFARATPAPALPNRNAHRQRFVYWVYARHARVATICARGSASKEHESYGLYKVQLQIILSFRGLQIRAHLLRDSKGLSVANN